MSDLISREAVLNEVMARIQYLHDAEDIKTHVEEAIKTTPSVEAVPFSVIEDIKAEIENYNVLKNLVGTSETFKLGVTKGLDLSAEIIDRKIAEVKGDKE